LKQKTCLSNKIK